MVLIETQSTKTRITIKTNGFARKTNKKQGDVRANFNSLRWRPRNLQVRRASQRLPEGFRKRLLKDFFKKLGDFISPLWDTFIFIAGIFSPLNKLKPNDDLEYAKEIEKEDSNINKTLDEGGVEGGESIDEIGAAILKEDEENLQAGNIFDKALNFLMVPAEAGTPTTTT